MEQSLSERVRQLECELQEARDLHRAACGRVAGLVNRKQELEKKLIEAEERCKEQSVKVGLAYGPVITILPEQALRAVDKIVLAMAELRRALGEDSGRVA